MDVPLYTNGVVMLSKEMILDAIEVAANKAIEAKMDEQVDKVLLLLSKMIPGQLDDVMIAKYAPEIKAQLKAEALKLSDKINGRAG